MKSLLDSAIDLAAQGFRVFPVKPRAKQPPMLKEFWERASTDPEELRRLWKFDPVMGVGESYNPAISTTHFRVDRHIVALIVIDVDPKHGGWDSLEDLQIIQGYHLPDTYEQHTPSGGAHYVYWIETACAGSESKLAPGLDIRSHHNYILGAGAETDAGLYWATVRPVAYAPEWLREWAAAHPPAGPRSSRRDSPVAIDRRRALRRAYEYLSALPPAPDGGRDASAYRAASRLRDFGLAEEDAVEQMILWFKFDAGSDPFTHADIEHATHSAYKYATGDAGGESADRYFAPIPASEAPEGASPAGKVPSPEGDPESESGTPLDLLNRNHAFVMLGSQSRIMWEFANHRGKPTREFLTVQAFKDKEAGNLVRSGDRMVEASTRWLRWNKRRSYDGTAFAPGRELSPRFYNTWQGWRYPPLARGERPTDGMREAVDRFKTLLLENYCAGVQKHADWLMGFYAQMFQKPQRKPRVALVFQGPRGIGKSAGNRIVGELVEPHLFVASEQRYLVGNFNSHMSETLFFILEEAFWGGNKNAESVLKEMVTGETVTIEQKFREAFRAESYMRIAIIGNEDWQVPAALRDERRWAVWPAEMRFLPFQTEADKGKVRQWFDELKMLLEAGGYRYLMTYFQGLDLEGFDVDGAPRTEGLVEQIEHTLSPQHQWWFECLRDGRIVGGDFPAGWPVDPEKGRLYDAFKRDCNERNITSRLPTAIAFGRELHRVCPSILLDKKNSDNQWVYRIPSLTVARAEWAKTIGRTPTWPGDEEDY